MMNLSSTVQLAGAVPFTRLLHLLNGGVLVKWFRFHAECLDNPKIQKLPAEVFRSWVNLMCVASLSEGFLPSIPDLAFKLRVTEDRADKLVAELSRVRLIDSLGERLKMHDWEQWQFQSDTSNTRVQKYRQERTKAGLSINGYASHKTVVFGRDDNTCIYCGSEENLCLDHVIPVPRGGDDDIMNLATACKKCNSGKSGRTPEMAGYVIRQDCAYAAIYVTNVKRLHGVNGHGSVSVSDSVSESEKQEKDALKPNGVLDDFAEFWEACETVELPFCGTDMREARIEWVRLDFEQKIAAVKGLHLRKQCGEFADPGYRPHPQNYLNKRTWERPLRQKETKQSKIEEKWANI